jgi:hypothetical protein
MKQKHLYLVTATLILLVSISACSPKSELSIEAHAIKPMNWEGEYLTFEPIEGTREDILATHALERSQSATSLTPPIKVGADTLNVMENYNGNLATVEVYLNDQLEMSIEAGVISPINNFRGLWVVDGDWILEVAHVEENPVDPNGAFNIWGEIFQNGESLNQKYGYDEVFNFQILHGKPFFFLGKDGNMGFSYDGKETALEYTEIPHYLCCSSAAFNPQAAENMVAFYASKGEQDFYVELGVFE